MNFIITWILDLFRPAQMPTAPIKAKRKPRAPAKKTAKIVAKKTTKKKVNQ